MKTILFTWFCAVTLPAFALNNEQAINAGAKGAITGLGLGIILGAVVVVWVLIKKVFSAAKAAVPKAKAVVEKGVETAKEFADRNKRCPLCAETIKKEAVVCPHCRRDIPQTTHSEA